VRAEGGLFARLDDWFNPIVVKELRQAVNGKFVAAVLILLLVIQLAALGIFIVANGDFSNDFTAGRNAFMILEGILLGISLLFVPAYAGIRLASERSDTNVDLLFITTIRPLSIVGGKLFSALVITTLIFSACMPFMAFTYWLRGIDLPSIFILLALSFLVVAATIQFTTFVASIPAGRVLKILLALLALGTFPNLFVGTLSGSFYLLQRGIGSRLGSWEFWGPATAILLIALAVNGILFSLSVAMITPPAANRALPVRVFITAMWLVSGVTAAIISYSLKDLEPLAIWGTLSAVIFCASAFVAVSERETLGPRVARTIPLGGAGRMAAFLLYSGGASGLVWCALMTALTFIAIRLSPRLFNVNSLGPSKLETETWIAGLYLYAFAYAATALFIRRTLLARWIGHKYTWAIAMVLLTAGCTVPFLLSYLLFFDTWRFEKHGMWLVGNPFVLGEERFRALYLVFAGTWAAVGVVVNVPWFADQIRCFRRWESSKAVQSE
jgi:hypothetical protein